MLIGKYPGGQNCYLIISLDVYEFHFKAKWVPELRKHDSKANILLVGTQIDLKDNQQKLDGQVFLNQKSQNRIITLNLELQKRKRKPVEKAEAEAVVKLLNLTTYKECSAFSQEGLKDVFDEAISIALEQASVPQPKSKFVPKCSVL